jgi:hypothetical protein
MGIDWSTEHPYRYLPTGWSVILTCRSFAYCVVGPPLVSYEGNMPMVCTANQGSGYDAYPVNPRFPARTVTMHTPFSKVKGINFSNIM